MGYHSRGRRPIERASKIAHGNIIKNPEVQAYVRRCVLPSSSTVEELDSMLEILEDVDTSEVTAVIALDGGFTHTYVRQEFPSATIAFFTFGPLLLELTHLRKLGRKRFISPEDIARLKKIERYTLVLPTKGIRLEKLPTLSSAIRHTIHRFFVRPREDDDNLMASLKWFLFRRWRRNPDNSLIQSVDHCPSECGHGSISFSFHDPAEKTCPRCKQPVFLTDVFRFHERIDDELGAGGIIAYVMTMLEQLVLVHLFYSIIERLKPSLMRNILFIKDGPLAFFGLVAPLYKPMRELTSYLLSEPDGPSGPILRLAGLEKTGAFVEHATLIQDHMAPGSYLVLGDSYIRRYIVPRDSEAVFGQNTYYGQKVIFRAQSGDMHVGTIPGRNFHAEPKGSDIPELQTILTLIAELRCSMYDNSLIPIALANKLVSLSHFPSRQILAAFAKENIQ